MRRLWRLIRDAARHLFRRHPAPLVAIRVEELPDNLDTKSVYLVGEGCYLWFAAMKCPCGCGSVLHMNLLAESRPQWKVTEHADGTVSLAPSVWCTKGCRSHFFLRRGLIDWFRDGETSLEG